MSSVSLDTPTVSALLEISGTSEQNREINWLKASESEPKATEWGGMSSRLNCVLLKDMVTSHPAPGKVTLFGNRVFAFRVKMTSYWITSFLIKMWTWRHTQEMVEAEVGAGVTWPVMTSREG